jgi:hypothetical protein
MRRGLSIPFVLVIGALAIVRSANAIQSNGYGPELTSFLDLMRHEEDELEFQIKHNEISRPEYIRSKSRIAIQRQMVLNRFKESGVDYVPELYVQTASEIDQVIEDGSILVKTVKPGDVIKEKWRYLGSVRRGETFYIFERLTVK